MTAASPTDGPGVGVFTGAGLSHDPPAQLPLGFTLRNAVLERCHRAAELIAPEYVSSDRLAALEVLDWKLEYVVGRLHGTMGDAALDVLAAVSVAIPNEGHLLSAVLLVQGGMHVTLNFDEGIERAYELLAGTSMTTSPPLPAEFEVALAEWRDRIGPVPSPLKVVASPSELHQWVGLARRDAPSSPVLVKLHGGVRTSDGVTRPYHPVVSDDRELAQLSAEQQRALDALGHCEVLVVTGYSGEDIDCYEPLLEVIRERQRGATRWAEPGKMRPSVEAALAELGVVPESVDAVTILRRHGIEDLPPWPRLERIPAPWEDEFEAWSSQVDDLEAAEAYAWMLIDAGELAEAIGIMRRVLARQLAPNARSLVRLADALYDSGHHERDEAMRFYRRVLASGRPSGGLSTYSWVRWGECHRPFGGAWNRAAIVLGPLMAALVARWDRAPDHVRARVLNSLAHTLARLVERAAPSLLGRRWGRRGGAALMSVVDRLQRRALRRLDHLDTPMGNRRSVIIYERIEGAALRAVLLGRTVDAETLLRALVGVRRSYDRVPDRRGVANTHAAEALVRLAQGRLDDAESELQIALEWYRRPNGDVDDSGRRLVESRQSIVRAARPGGV